MITYRDICAALSHLGLRRETPAIAHISLSRIGAVRGGLNTVMGALLATIDNIIIPTFTFSTMIIPEEGPPHNDIEYGSGRGSNLEAKAFTYDLPSDHPVRIYPSASVWARMVYGPRNSRYRRRIPIKRPWPRSAG